MPSQAVHAAPAPAVAPSRTRPPVDHRRMAKIIVRYGSTETTHELTQDVTTVGRSSQNTLALKDVSLSRTHCELRRAGDGWTVHDLGSRNGTLVNGQSVKEKRLEAGDKIEIGSTVIIYERPIPGRDYTPKEKERDKEPESGVKAPQGRISGLSTKSKIGRESGIAAPQGLADCSFWAKEGRGLPRWLLPAAVVLVLAAGGFVAWQTWSRGGSSAADANLVKQNPSFEGKRGADGLPEGWRALAGTKALVAVVQTQAHGGPNSLLVDKSQAGGELASGAEYGPAIAVSAGATYSVGAWVRSEGFRGDATVRVRWFAAGGDLPLGEDAAEWAKAPSDWKEVRRVLAAPEGAARMALACLASGIEGKVYFDDVSVEPSTATPVSETRASIGPFRVFAGTGGALRLSRDAGVLLSLGEVGFRTGGEETRQGVGRVTRREAKGRSLSFVGTLPDPAGGREAEYEAHWTERGQDLSGRLRCRRPPKADPLAFTFRLDPSQVKSLTVRGGGGSREAGRPLATDGGGADGDQLTVELAKGVFTLRFVPTAHVSCAAVEDTLRVTCEFKGAADDGGEALLLVGSGRDVAPPQAATGGRSIAETLAEAKRDEEAGRTGEAISGYHGVLALAAAAGTREAEEARMRLAPLEEAAAAAIAEGRRLARLAQLTGSADAEARAARALSAAAKTWAGSDYGAEAKAALDEVTRQSAESAKADAEARAARLFQLAEETAREGHWNLAETCFRRIVAQFPDTDWALKAQGRLEKGPE